MANLSEAYDFSLFEDRIGQSTAPIGEPGSREQRQEQKRENVIELPQKELDKNRQPKRHPFRMIAATLCFTVIFATVVSIVYSQVQLTELTEEINIATQQLQEEQSLEVQMSMQASQKMNGAQVEEYAKKELGMSKISEGQVSYVNVVQQDKGTVLQDTDGGSWFDKSLSAVESWFA